MWRWIRTRIGSTRPSSCDTDRLYVFHGATLATSCTYAAVVQLWGVAVNPATNKVYVANFVSGDLYVLDATTLSPPAIIPVGPKPTFVNTQPGHESDLGSHVR